MTTPTVTYTWKIERIDCAPTEGELTNVVRRLHWRLIGTDGTNTMDVFGDVPLASPNPAEFVAYPQLTEATVITWLEATINARVTQDEPSVAQLRAGLSGMLAAKRAPVVMPMPAPWA
jgi:hypothetical protein